MQFLLWISDFIVPFMFIVIIAYGCSKKAPIYDYFIEGAKEGMTTVVHIFPTILGLMVAVGILRASGVFELLVAATSPLANFLGFPMDTVPLIFMRLVSSSASVGLLTDIFKTHGPDSFTGRFTSVMMSCTETVFYTMSVYFMSVKITKTRYTLPGALFANVVGVMASLFITLWVFGR